MTTGFIFVSGNLKKREYLERFLGQKVEHSALDLKEIQSLDPLEVVREKAIEAYKVLKKPVLIEDTSLRLEAMGRLPGTFIKFFLEEIGCEGICAIMLGQKNKNAAASVIYGYYDGSTFYTFDAEVRGKVTPAPRGINGMGWDPIFIPDGSNKTYAEMDEKDLPKYSARNKAVQKLKRSTLSS